MTKLSLSATFAALAFAMVSCERHTWEDTQVLHLHHGEHSDHDDSSHGHEAHEDAHHGDEKAKHHDEKKAAPDHGETHDAEVGHEEKKEARNLGL